MIKLSFVILTIALICSVQVKAQVTWVDFPYTKSEEAKKNAHDSVSFEKIKGGWTLVKTEDNIGRDYVKIYGIGWDIYFNRDSLYNISYPFQYGSEQRVISRPDTLLTLYNEPSQIDYHVQSIEWMGDTLVLVDHYGGGGFEGDKEYYIRKDIPFDSLLALRVKKIDLNYLTGKWELDSLISYKPDSLDPSLINFMYLSDNEMEIETSCYNFYPFDIIDFGSIDEPRKTSEGTIITLIVDGELFQFEYVIERSIFYLGEIVLRPLTQCQCSDFTLRYYRIDE